MKRKPACKNNITDQGLICSILKNSYEPIKVHLNPQNKSAQNT